MTFLQPLCSLDPFVLDAGQNCAALVDTGFLQNFQTVSGWGPRARRLGVCAAASEFRQWPRTRVLIWVLISACLSEQELYPRGMWGS